ncbi:hypothetical protein EDB84DRAFT_1007766 [Lactarius hengduanensis]|nr:hypothetical protein EDB84DRAFT_1007766 [Lactarius hengduanensis]
MAFNRAEKLKAEAPTLLLNFIHGLVQEFSMHLRSLGSNDQRDAAFRWITLSLQTTLDPRPIVMRTTATAAAQLTTWLKDTALFDPPWKKRQQHSYKLLIDTLSEYSECLKVSHGPATIAPIDLVMVVLSSSRLVGALRMAARWETKDLMWKGEHMGYYLVFLDRLERLGEVALNTGGGKDARVAMDVDPPPKRQRRAVRATTISLSSPVSSVPSAAVPSRSTSTPRRTSTRVQQHASQFPTPRPPSAVPSSPLSPTIPTIFTPAISTCPVSASSPGTSLGGPRDARVDACHVPVSAPAGEHGPSSDNLYERRRLPRTVLC